MSVETAPILPSGGCVAAGCCCIIVEAAAVRVETAPVVTRGDLSVGACSYGGAIVSDGGGSGGGLSPSG